MRTHIRSQWLAAPTQERFRTGVSLHSHTLHSRESFDFIRRAGLRTPLIADLIVRVESSYYRRRGKRLDLDRAWWTPPLSPREIWTQERSQLERLGLNPLVAITDHDDMQAPVALRVLPDSRKIPIALEWTVPFGPTFFHLGIYNVPENRAAALFQAMQEYRSAPSLRRLPEILAEIARCPGTLAIFNHPLWDENGIGEERHRDIVRTFLQIYGQYIHALEINGLRPPEENDLVRRLAVSAGKPAISGGDRHGPEANAVVNLTNAATFGEFADEIRTGASTILLLEPYRKPHRWRIVRSTLDMLRTYHGHPNGWRIWTDRAFHRGEDGTVRSWTQVLGPTRAGVAWCLGLAFGKPVLHPPL